MKKVFDLPPVGYKYNSFEGKAKVEASLTEGGKETVYEYSLLSFGDKVLTVKITASAQGCSLRYSTTEKWAFGKAITKTTSKHITAFLEYVSQQSGQKVRAIFDKRFKGRKMIEKMACVPYF